MIPLSSISLTTTSLDRSLRYLHGQEIFAQKVDWFVERWTIPVSTLTMGWVCPFRPLFYLAILLAILYTALFPRDDIESLAYTLIHLLRGDLPWRDPEESWYGRPYDEYEHMDRVWKIKQKWSVSKLAEGCPTVFGELLDHARSLQFSDRPAYSTFRQAFQSLNTSIPADAPQYASSGQYPKEPLPEVIEVEVQPAESVPDESGEGPFTDSYFGRDIETWDERQRGGRDRSLTVPSKDHIVQTVDIPMITEIIDTLYPSLLR